jgi:predicted peptidase
MKYYPRILTACLVLIFWNCKDESEEIVPKPVAVQIKNDSTASVPPVADADTVSENNSPPVAPPPSQPKSDLNFSDSAYYQSAKSGGMPYRVMTPSSYDSAKKYPLVIFLHGIDERGTDNEKQLKWGASLFKSENVRNEFPSFVIFPQCPDGYYWAADQPMHALKTLIDSFAAKNNVDKNRIYIVGLSMGAYGTYEMVARNAGLFAAAVAISGDGDINRVKNMAKSDWRIFGGKKDYIVTADKSEKMAHALENSGANVSLKIYPNANHMGSWVNAFAEPDFCSWLYSVSK